MARRRHKRQQHQEQFAIPDWAWGLGLGLIVVIIVGGYFLITQVGGGSSAGACGKALPPLPGTVEVTAEGFQQEDVALGTVIDFLSQGNLDKAFESFYGDTHAFTHNIDPDVRPLDEVAATELCEAVIKVETDFDPPPPAQRSFPQMISSTETLREKLRDAAELLGFARPTG